MKQPQRGGGRGNFGRYNGRGRGRTFRRGGGQGRSLNRTDGLECYYCGNRGHISTGCNVRLEDKKRGVYSPINKPQQSVAHVEACTIQKTISQSKWDEFTIIFMLFMLFK